MTIDEFKKNIAPFMHKGYVAMDKDNSYFWYKEKPRRFRVYWRNKKGTENFCFLGKLFNIEPVEDWTQSLIEVGKKIKSLKNKSII